MRRWSVGISTAILLTFASLVAPKARAQRPSTEVATQGPRFLLASASKLVPLDVDRTPVLARRLALSLGGVTLKQALAAISAQSGLRLFYSDDVVPLAWRVHLRADAITVMAALTDVLLGAGVDVVFNRDGRASLVKRTSAAALQVGAVVGRVTDSKTDQELGGVDIALEGTRWRTTTDASGRYRITDVAPGSYTVLARRIGYGPERRAVTVTAGQEIPVDVALQPAATRLGDVVVTAQKREERAFDVPTSIVAIPADELQQRKVSTIDDLSMAVPGLFIQSGGSFSRRIMLRGVSNVFGNSSLIGLYLDEASVTSGPTAQLDLRTYDLERVEVLRGPQGTLYGEGSVGGTIRFITKNPQLDRFSMNADAAALSTEDGRLGRRIEAALNVPVIDNKFGLRIVGAYDHQAGWIGQPAADRDDINDSDLADVRVKGLWQPTPQFAVNAMAVIHRNDGSTNFGEDANGNFTQAFNLTTTPGAKDDYDLYNVTLTYDFAAAQVVSTTSYITQDKALKNSGQRFQFTPPGTPQFDSYLPLYTVGSGILTQELRLTSTSSGAWQWTIGGFYRNAEFDTAYPDGFFFGLSGPLPPPFPIPPSNNLSKSWAVFGDLSYELTDRLTLGAGLRYFEDDQEFTNVSIQAAKFNTVNPRFYAQYQLIDQINTYASAAKGFRSGGFNALGQPTYDPEDVWTYELGTKMSLLEGRLSAEVAVFYSDYTNYQILATNPGAGPTGLAFITRNAGNARIKGVEWGLNWRPADQWTLGVNGNYVDSEFDEINGAFSTHAVGDPLDLFPKYGYTVSAQRDFKWNGRGGFARLDYNAHGRATFRNRSIGPWYFSESDIIDILNFHTSLQYNDHLSLGVFAQNLLNDRGFTDPFSIEAFGARSRPRSFGIGFGVTF